jgi:DNA-binding HxlR family transcriptional regulator
MSGPSISQKKLTTPTPTADCPAEALLQSVSGKWKPGIILLASQGPVRFSQLLRSLEGSNKQSITTALRELEEDGLLDRVVIRLKPLHVEYTLTPLALQLVPLLKGMEGLG